MSNRPHAHSKRKRSAPSRSFSAATGLHGVTEAEMAHRTQITEAALAEVEKSATKATRSTRSTKPKAPRGPAARPPRSFSVPAEPAPSPEADTAAGIESDPAAFMASPHQGEDDLGGATSPESSAQGPGQPGDGSSPRVGSARPRRDLWSKLSAAVGASEAVAAKVITSVKPGRSDAAGDGAGQPQGDRLETTSRVSSSASAGTGTDSNAPKGPPSVKRPSARAVVKGPKASRAPKSARPTRRPSERSRSEPKTGPTKTGIRRLGPLRGRRKKTVGGAAAEPLSETAKRTRVSAAPSAQAPTAQQRTPPKQKAPATPEQRRRRIPVAIAGAFALAVLATSFPLSSILSQHHALAAAGAQLEQVQKENQALTQQEHALDSNVAVTQLARGELQMVSPGQTLYDVLPPSSRTGAARKTPATGATATTAPGSAVNGDPGNQPLVAPANAPDLTAQAALAQPTPVQAAASTSGATGRNSVTSPPTASTAPSAPATFWGRVGETLQFWK